MARAAEALGVPVVSGNVSLYNDTNGVSIPPTPVVGCVGLVADVRRVPSSWREGDLLFLLSAGERSLAGSEYQARWGEVSGRPPALDLGAEAALVEALWCVAPRATLVHDVSEGGLAVCLAEMALHSALGAALDLEESPEALFGVGGGAAVVALAPAEAEGFEPGVDVTAIGEVGGDTVLGVPLRELEKAWAG
jgi:phosphoribosylformylglycinamidine synthase